MLTCYCILLLFLASRIRYEITRGNIGGAFAVKNMTGAIYVAGPLDYETRRRVSINTHPEMTWQIFKENFFANYVVRDKEKCMVTWL